MQNRAYFESLTSMMTPEFYYALDNFFANLDLNKSKLCAGDLPRPFDPAEIPFTFAKCDMIEETADPLENWMVENFNFLKAGMSAEALRVRKPPGIRGFYETLKREDYCYTIPKKVNGARVDFYYLGAGADKFERQAQMRDVERQQRLARNQQRDKERREKERKEKEEEEKQKTTMIVEYEFQPTSSISEDN
ncbi:hypothetical protein FACS189472_14050 [Alphaproteobacteria bacterium]|nr:hypothetical protein FACS189472_14050 [Alphaproteobacteria bacterium]